MWSEGGYVWQCWGSHQTSWKLGEVLGGTVTWFHFAGNTSCACHQALQDPAGVTIYEPSTNQWWGHTIACPCISGIYPYASKNEVVIKSCQAQGKKFVSPASASVGVLRCPFEHHLNIIAYEFIRLSTSKWWFPKIGVPPNHPFYFWIFHCKPSIVMCFT